MLKNMFKNNLRILLLVSIAATTLVMSSCVNSLNTTPIDKKVITSASAYNTPQDYEQILAKLYAGFATTGQQGPAGDPDIQGIDEGSSGYLRAYWMLEELPTDEAICAWNDPGVPQLNTMTWGASNNFIMDMYDRIYYEITLANEIISHAKTSSNPQVKEYMAEARYIRALCYWHALDLYGGNVPFVTEKNGIGAYLPKPAATTEAAGADSLFNYITGELKAIEPDLPAPGQNQQYRVDQAADWTLLAKVYLNEQVYTGNSGYANCITYAKKVIDSGVYTLDPSYQHLFEADNNTAKGIIWSIAFDGTHIQTYAGTNYIVHAEVGGSMSGGSFGIDGGWAGNRLRPQFVDLFNNQTNDGRDMMYTNGQTKDIAKISDFTNGYATTKWTNMTSTGSAGSNPSFVDTDFPMFRLADVYLMYAEAVVRSGDNADMATAVGLINKLRERAYGNNSGDITQSQLTLPFILDERGRELYWEATRRTDLIRFGEFTGSKYVWSWKGGVQNGTGTDSHFKLYPIPSTDLNANPNLTQNTGY